MTIGDQLVETMQTHLDLSHAEALARAERLLAEVGIPAPRERLQSYPHEMSGGMRQRVVLALAFCCEPRLIIADEPTTALDVSIQAQILDLLRRMCRERGTAVMLVTHDMGVIAEATDRVAVMYAGRLVEIGPTESLIAAAAHPYTRGLMASIPDMHRREAELTQIPGSMPRPDAPVPGCAFHPRCPQALARCTTERPATFTRGAVAGRLLARRAECGVMAVKDTLLSVDRLTVRFDASPPLLKRLLTGAGRRTVHAVEEVDFEVARGSTFALVGEIRLRQVDHRPHHRRHPAAHGRQRLLHGRRHRRLPHPPRRHALSAQPTDDLPGPLCQPRTRAGGSGASWPSRS